MVTKTLSDKKNNRYLWEKGHVEVHPSEIEIKERSKKELEQRRISDRSFKIWNPDGSLYAEMLDGKWVKKPKEEKTK